MFCREQVARYQERLPEIAAAGASVLAVGNGTAPMAADFVERFGITFPVFTDPSRETYRIAGMERRLGIGLKTVANGWRALRSGHLQGLTRGDPLQQGGVVVIAPEQGVLFFHSEGAPGEHAPIDDVLAALRSARGGS